MKQGDKVAGTLVFLREPEAGGTPDIIRMPVLFDVTSAPDWTASDYRYDKNQSISVSWRGNVDFPAAHSLAQEFADAGGSAGASLYRGVRYRDGRWHVMGFIGSVPSGLYSPNLYSSDSKIAFNYLLDGDPRSSHAVERYSQGLTSWGDAGRGSIRELNIPFISQWKAVRILEGNNASYTGLVEGLKFRPQGTDRKSVV